MRMGLDTCLIYCASTVRSWSGTIASSILDTCTRFPKVRYGLYARTFAPYHDACDTDIAFVGRQNRLRSSRHMDRVSAKHAGVYEGSV